ncbi:hypothetical protein DVH24_039777 [Malus domestica]|uniref:Uncharacterized protein n=1 Tax=Malus domestica TaxID=3750 RepID=A0A498I2N3_MALDO|nr:hypothetical protein DVH24_039777 [Malus domestica]
MQSLPIQFQILKNPAKLKNQKTKISKFSPTRLLLNDVSLNGDKSNSISVSEPGSPCVRVSSNAFFVDFDRGYPFQARDRCGMDLLETDYQMGIEAATEDSGCIQAQSRWGWSV